MENDRIPQTRNNAEISEREDLSNKVNAFGNTRASGAKRLVNRLDEIEDDGRAFDRKVAVAKANSDLAVDKAELSGQKAQRAKVGFGTNQFKEFAADNAPSEVSRTPKNKSGAFREEETGLELKADKKFKYHFREEKPATHNQAELLAERDANQQATRTGVRAWKLKADSLGIGSQKPQERHHQ